MEILLLHYMELLINYLYKWRGEMTWKSGDMDTNANQMDIGSLYQFYSITHTINPPSSSDLRKYAESTLNAMIKTKINTTKDFSSSSTSGYFSKSKK